jgi:signal transduction histidine kinase
MVSPEGISRFDSGRFTSYTSSDILLARTIQQDPTGALWIGTYGYGLFRFRDGVFRRVTTADGLPEAVVSSMLPDGYDYVWMSGNRGIHRCNWEHLNQVADRIRPQLDCVSLNAADGLITSEANGIGEPAGIVAPDGRLWFATVRGVAVIDPKPLPETKIPLIIEQVSVDGGPVPADSPIVIRPGQKNLQISYTAPTFLRPERVQFRYRFEEGPDSSWSDAGHQRTVTFQGLAPGSYSFHVISDNGFGFWNPVGARLRFRIAAPFWRSGWFLSLASLLLVASGVLVHQLRLRSVKNAHALQQTFSRMLIESQERERQSIAAELHDSLGQSLLVMKNKAFLAAKSLPNPQTAGQQLADISALAADAIDEVRAITFNLHPYRLDRFGLTRSILGMCAQAFESAGIAFKTDVDSIDGVFSKEAERSMFRVVQEAVNNIIKHSGSTNAEVVVKREANRVRISIRDNGRGFVASEVPGRSFGLRGMAERIKMLGGTYSVLSSDGTGTTIHIELKA